VAVWVCPELSSAMLTLSPGWYWLMAVVRSLAVLTALPPSEVITSPAASPAFLSRSARDRAGHRGAGCSDPVLPVLPELPEGATEAAAVASVAGACCSQR